MSGRRKKARASRGGRPEVDFTPSGVGLDPDLYATAIRYLFDRPVPEAQQTEWYWSEDATPPFAETSLTWTRIQTVLFANAGEHLAAFSNEQVGMGLNYVMNNAISNVPYAACDPTVPATEGLRMMEAMPRLWRECIGPRLSAVNSPIGSGAGGRLGFVCYMWFDVWPTFWNLRHLLPWRDALWNVFLQMLAVPCREVQIAALHGISHNVKYLDRDGDIDQAISSFVRTIASTDEKLVKYADAARVGGVL